MNRFTSCSAVLRAHADLCSEYGSGQCACVLSASVPTNRADTFSLTRCGSLLRTVLCFVGNDRPEIKDTPQRASYMTALSANTVISLVVSCNQMSATSNAVASSGKCLRSEGLLWLVGAVVCLLAALSFKAKLEFR